MAKANHPLKDANNLWKRHEVIPIIVQRLEQGLSMPEALAMQYEGRGMPSASSVERWAVDDCLFAEDIARTRKARASKLAEDTITIADEDPKLTAKGMVDNGAERHRATKINARQWLAEKLDPKTFGSQQNIDVQSHLHIDMTALLSEAQGRTISGTSAPVIDPLHLSPIEPVENSELLPPGSDCADLFS